MSSFRKRNMLQKNAITVYSEYSYSGIVPKERALNYYIVFHWARQPDPVEHNPMDRVW